MMKTGLVGWRGMVGSVLMQRMEEEGDFDLIQPTFFTTSQKGKPAPVLGGKDAGLLEDAFDIEKLAEQDVVITCQGGDYTKAVYSKHKPTPDKDYVDVGKNVRLEIDPMVRARAPSSSPPLALL